MSHLIELPNGAFVRPSAVTAIRWLPTEAGVFGGLNRARVAVHHGCGFIELLLCNDDDHAREKAKEIAAMVNAAPVEQAEATHP